jgi:hypothetical protein
VGDEQWRSTAYRRIEAHSGCPINLTLEMLGDRWSLIVIRDGRKCSVEQYVQRFGGAAQRICGNRSRDPIAFSKPDRVQGHIRQCEAW